MAALTLAVGTFGWLLGGLRPTTMIHAGAWWALAWVTLMVVGGHFQYPGFGVSRYLGRAPYWTPIAIFGAAAIVTFFVSAYRRASPGQKTLRPIPSAFR